MKLEYAYLAEFALAHPDSRVYVIGGGIDRIHVDTLPFRHPSLSLVLKLHFEAAECGVEHHVQVNGSGPGASKLLSNANITLRPELDRAAPNMGTSLHSVLNIQGILITAFGEHVIHVDVGGKRLASVSLQVLNAASRGPAPHSRLLQ